MASPQSHHRLLNQQILQLPHRQDGSINYTVLGNMLTAKILGEVLEVSFVDEEYGVPKEQRLKSAESNWVFAYKENDVSVYKKKKHNSKTHCFVGRGVIDVPLRNVVNYIHKFRSRLEWDDFVLQIEICKAISENDWLYYMAHEATQCLFTSRRDFFLYSRTGYVDGKYIQAPLSIEHKDYPHRPPYIRGEIMQGSGWVLEKYRGSECSTLVSYLANIDLKELPASIMDKVLKRQPMAIHIIRKKLTTAPLLDQSKNSGSSLESSQSDEYSTPQVNQSDVFEDTIPIDHYTNRDIEKSEEIDPNTPMYPWVTDRKALAKARLQQRNRSERTLGLSRSSNSKDTNSTDGTKERSRTNSWSLAKSQDKPVEERLLKSVDGSVNPHNSSSLTSKNEQVTPATLQAVEMNGEQRNCDSPTVFPSFSTWSKEQ